MPFAVQREHQEGGERLTASDTAHGAGRRRPSGTMLGASGDPGRSRTCDPLLRRQVLYPLSYGTDA
jgi:hypothetical protein